jgi:hypothetical protein
MLLTTDFIEWPCVRMTTDTIGKSRESRQHGQIRPDLGELSFLSAVTAGTVEVSKEKER